MVKNSEFDNNEDGFDTNSQNGDNPPPQNGACPNGGVSPVTAHEFVLGVHAQLRPRQQQPERARPPARLPRARSGTGMSVSGGRNDTIIDNRFVEQQGLGRDLRAVSGQRPAVHGRHRTPLGAGSCLYDE